LKFILIIRWKLLYRTETMAETRNLPRDVFMYFLTIITLVASAVNLGILIFQFINIYFPDILSDYNVGNSAYFGSIRQALAFLIVVFPVYVWASRFIRRDIKANPEKKDLRIRRWLLYLTVFAAGLVIIGDLVTLLQTYLNGEISVRFILKVVTIFFIAGSVFYYYFRELKVDEGEKGSWNMLGIRAFPWAVISVVLAAVIAGFFIAGTPTDRRIARFDERRVQDLSSIQSQIITYWQNKKVLPPVLGDLTNDILNITVPVDPKTGGAYEYKILGSLKFQLCATFETENRGDINNIGLKTAPLDNPQAVESMAINSVWDHGIGRTCFERTIDPDIFKPIVR